MSSSLASGKIRSYFFCCGVYLAHRDTVSSVGIIPQPHPYSSLHYCVKYFRHALALDEYRCRFRPDLWCEVTSESEQKLDLDLPHPPDIGNARRDDWQYTPPKRDRADVKEVWFSGYLTLKNTPAVTYNSQVNMETSEEAPRSSAMRDYRSLPCVG